MQGLDWYTKGLKEDRDGDVATEFLEEASTPHAAQQRSAVEDAHASLQAGIIPRILRSSTRLARILNVSAAQDAYILPVELAALHQDISMAWE